MLKPFKTRDDFGNVNVGNLPIILADQTVQMRRHGKNGIHFENCLCFDL